MEFSASQGGNEGSNEGAELDPGLYPGIEDVPSEYRQHIDPILAEINKNANNKVTEVNEKLGAWKPYEDLGVNQLEPETVGQLLSLLQMMGNAEEDPTELKEWWEELGNHFKFSGSQEDDDLFENDDENEALTKDDLAQLIAETVKEQFNPFIEERTEREENEKVRGAEQMLDEELKQVADDNNFELTPEVEERICKFALSYDGEGAIAKGWNDYKQVIEGAEGNLFAQLENQPNTPEGPAVPNTAPEKITDFKSATQAARNQLEASVNT